jgi:hypothetical protein
MLMSQLTIEQSGSSNYTGFINNKVNNIISQN